MSKLRDFQWRMYRAIIYRHTLDKAISPDGFGLEIYQNAYRMRLYQAFSQTYPQLLKQAGRKKFFRWVRHVILRERLIQPSLHQTMHLLPLWLQKKQASRLWIEWAQWELAIHQLHNITPVSPPPLQAESILHAPMMLSSSCIFLTQYWNIADMDQQIRNGNSEPMPMKHHAPQWICLWKSDDRTWHWSSIDPSMKPIFKFFYQPCTLNKAFTQFESIWTQDCTHAIQQAIERCCFKFL